MKENLFSKPNRNELDAKREQDPGGYWVRCLALALTHKWTAPVMAVVAAKARCYLMKQPTAYDIIRAKFPQIVRLCQITESQHKKLMAEALKIKTRLCKRHLSKILTFIEHRHTNGPMEGLNNAIQGLTKMAYGFRNKACFKTDIFSTWVDFRPLFWPTQYQLPQPNEAC